MILVKIYLYFAANSFWRRRGTLTSCAETKSKGEKVVICLQGKELLEKPCTSSCSILCFLPMGLKYRDKQGEWTIDFRCNENNHALCWGWQIRLSTLDNHHCPQPSASVNRACLRLTIWSVTLNTGHGPDAGKTTAKWVCYKFSPKWLPREADSDKTLVLLMNRRMCLIAGVWSKFLGGRGGGWGGG